jgi:Leucine-rich repeat (LRR) protein
VVNLDLSGNKIVGQLPDNLFSMEKLVILDLNTNYFTGPLPTQVTAQAPLELLALYNNRLDGTIDIVANKLTNLKHLDLSNNGFTGQMPSFVLLEELRYLYLFNTTNLGEGPIPASIAQLPLLIDLSLQHSRRTGSIPTELGNLKKLTLLDLGSNNLKSKVPEELSEASALEFIFLGNNHLTGSIPDSFSKLKYLKSLLVDKNDMMGPPGQICQEKPALFNSFIADCQEISCPTDCCTVCCVDSNTTCNDQIWNGQLDPVRSSEYKRDRYQFYDNGIIYPVSPEQQPTNDNWDMWGTRL